MAVKQPHDLQCIYCGNDFQSCQNFAKFCSDECRRRFHQNHDRLKKGIRKLVRTCPTCSKNFETYLKRQIYCHKDCYTKSQIENYAKRSVLGLRFSILLRDKFTCQYCGRTPQQNIILHVDHIIPKSKGGEDIKENLVASCEDCNLGKAGSHFGEILTYLKDKNFKL